MSLAENVSRLYDIILREFPHRAQTGLFPIGRPGKDSPVILTGNYTETVRRMRNVLRGENVWLLVANSKGINVWCAAGGGHFTHHDVISSVVTSGVQERVEKHLLILPQLGATGIERRKITEATGWDTIWGPARLEDLPDYLRLNHVATPRQRFMRFPFSERMEMATLWGIPMIAIGFILFAIPGGIVVGTGVAIASAIISYGIFAAMPVLKIKGQEKWVPLILFTLIGILFSWILLYSFNAYDPRNLILTAVGSIIEMLVFSIDLAGTTPWYGSYINTFKNHAHIDLVADRCNGSADCLLVCPRDVFRMNGKKHKVDLKSPKDCIECGACIVQCPRDALRFRYDNGRIVEPSTIRRTRMNMLGKRTISVRDEAEH